VVTKQQLEISVKITTDLLNKAVIEQTLPRRMIERVERAQALILKKKLDRISLGVIIGVILATSVVFIIESVMDIFTGTSDYIYIPVITMIAILIVGTMLAIEYFMVKKEGTKNLQNLSTIVDIDKRLMALQKEDTLVYNYVKNAFKAIQKIDSKYFLNGLIIRYYVYMTEKEHDYPIEKLYHHLFLASSKKNLLIIKVMDESEIELAKEKIIEHLSNIEFMFMKIQEMKVIPNYYIIKAKNSLEVINQFKLTKGEFVIKKGKVQK
jgi:hypothetical protein